MTTAVLLWLLVNVTHVLSHLLVTRVFGIEPHQISFGIGPTLLRRPWRGGSIRLALLPVAIVVTLRRPAPWPPDDSDRTDLRARSRPTRLLVFAAPLVGLGLLALASSYWVSGSDRQVAGTDPVIGEVVADGPAARAGLLVGDTLITVGSMGVSSFDDVRRALQSSTEDVVTLVVRRDGELAQATVTPELHNGVPKIGVAARRVTQPAPTGWARVVAAVDLLADAVDTMALGVSRTLLALAPTEPTEVTGPIAVVKDYGFQGGGQGLVAVFSIVLQLAYCLFLPFLDGARLLFLGIEALLRRPLHPKYERRFNWAWFGVLGLLVIVAFVNDVMGLLS